MRIVILLQCVLIITLIFVILRQNKKIIFLKNQYTDGQDAISGKDLFENITKSKLLYKDLLIEFHPDRFENNPTLKSFAEEVTFKLAENKSSYRNLISIASSVKKDFQFTEKFINRYPEIFG